MALIITKPLNVTHSPNAILNMYVNIQGYDSWTVGQPTLDVRLKYYESQTAKTTMTYCSPIIPTDLPSTVSVPWTKTTAVTGSVLQTIYPLIVNSLLTATDKTGAFVLKVTDIVNNVLD